MVYENTDGNDCTGPDCDYAYEEDLTGENDISDELRSREISSVLAEESHHHYQKITKMLKVVF